MLEFTRPAIRLLRKLPKFGKALDRNYRNYGLSLTLNELRDFDQVQFNDALLKRLNDAARFAVYEKDHVLFREGDPINRVFFVRNGWIQRVSGVEFNPRAAEIAARIGRVGRTRFLGAGTMSRARGGHDESAEWNYTAIVRGRTEVIEVAVTRLREDIELREPLMTFFSTRTAAAENAVRASG